MYTATTQIRVRYAETDQMGHVYHANYVIYHEAARVEAMRQLGFSYKELEEKGVMMPVYDNACKFLAPAFYDELLTIEVTVPELPKVRMKFSYRIFNEKEKLIHTGETTLFFMTTDSRRPCRAPEDLIEILKPHFDEK